jgi:short-chain Z-isoprenyl diphosphate synthase
VPAPTVAAIRTAEEATATYDDGLALTIAIAYGGHDEITDAVRALLRAAANEGKALAEAIEASVTAAISTSMIARDDEGRSVLGRCLRVPGEAAQSSTFCIPFSFCDDCLSLASIVRADVAGRAFAVDSHAGHGRCG